MQVAHIWRITLHTDAMEWYHFIYHASVLQHTFLGTNLIIDQNIDLLCKLIKMTLQERLSLNVVRHKQKYQRREINYSLLDM